MKKDLFIVILICLVLTGCKLYVDDTDVNYNSDEIELYTESNKLVYRHYDSYYIVVNYKNDRITNLSYYYDYEDESNARIGLDMIKDEYSDNKKIDNIVREKQYVIVNFKEEEYSKYDYDSIKEKYSNLELVRE